MKILHVVRQFAPAIGGLESYVKSMATYQQAAGHTCEILTLNQLLANGSEATTLPATEVIDGLPITRIGFTGRRRFFIPHVRLGYLKQFDLTHVHNTDGFFDTLACLSPIVRKPMVATTHGGFFHTKDFSLIKTVYFNTVTRLATQAYKTIFATSENDFHTFSKLTSKLDLKPNAVEPLGDFTANGDGFIYIGRLASHKNISDLIKSFAIYKSQHQGEGILHIVGPEWDVKRDDLKALAKSLQVETSVNVHGFVTSSDLQDILKTCSFFVSASSFEGFGMSMIEGMSVGLIPLVQPNESFKVLIEQGGVGACVDFLDPTNAAQAMAAHSGSVTAAQRKTARSFAGNFSWKSLSESTLATYQRILA